MGGIFDIVFGSEPEPQQTRSGYEALPQWLKDDFRGLVDRGLGGIDPETGQRTGGVVNDTAPYEAIPLNQYSYDAISNYYGGQGFDFGKRASSAYDQAMGTLSMAPGYAQEGMNFARAGAAPVTRDEIYSSAFDFMNPYEELVAGRVGNNMSRMIDTKLAESRARAGGALGNTRVGVEGANIISEGSRALGDTLSSLYRSGYDSSMGMGMDRINQGRNNMFRVGEMGLNTSTALTNAGNAMGGMGNNLFNARLGMANLRGKKLDEQLGIGDIFRNQQAQNNQIPLRQMQTYQDLLTPFLNASQGTGATQGQAGLLGGYGDIGRGVGNVLFSPLPGGTSPANLPGGGGWA